MHLPSHGTRRPSTRDTAARWEPGHHYSPIPSLEEIARDEDRIFHRVPPSLPGIALREEEQLHLLRALKHYGDVQPFRDERVHALRYCFSEAASFSYADAVTLHCMIRHLRPSTVVEVGSGWSTCVMLDTVEQSNMSTRTQHIDPYIGTMKDIPFRFEQAPFATVREERVQDVPQHVFDFLKPNDILFIDSSHVCKTGSDVEHIFAEILPKLRSGVYVHFHDIFYPFEYPKEWVYEGRAWNEAYVLRAFLYGNTSFAIRLFHSYLTAMHAREFYACFPLAARNPGGSLWLRKE